MPVIPALGRLRQVDHEVRSLRPAWPTWHNSVSTKNTKISWAWCICPKSQLLGGGEALRQEKHLNPGGGGCSEPRLGHYTPAGRTEQDFVSKKRKEKKRKVVLIFTTGIYIR